MDLRFDAEDLGRASASASETVSADERVTLIGSSVDCSRFLQAAMPRYPYYVCKVTAPDASLPNWY